MVHKTGVMAKIKFKDISFYKKNLEAEDFEAHAGNALSRLPKILGNNNSASGDSPGSIILKVVLEEKKKLEQGITLAKQGRQSIFSPYSKYDLEKAIGIFREMPTASTLLAICYADLAAHYHITNHFGDASVKAREALLLLNDKEGLNPSKALASWIKGSVHYNRGRRERGIQYYNAAKAFYSNMPDSHYFLEKLEQDEVWMQKVCAKRNKKWWQFWI